MNNPIPLIIHDPLRIDRYELLLKELASQNIEDYIFIDADKSTNNPRTNISRSFKKAVKIAQEKNWNELFVFEDDLHFCNRTAWQDFLRIKKLLPDNWEVFIAGAYAGAVQQTFDEFVSMKDFSALHCVCFRESMYETILQADERINLDRFIGSDKFGEIQCANKTVYCAMPLLMMQHDGFSDNTKRQTNYNKNIPFKIKTDL